MPVEQILPLSPLQEGLLFHALYDGTHDAYTVQLVLGLEGPLDASRLEAAIGALLRRHTTLRAAFQYENLSRPVQIILSAVPSPLHRIDLSSFDEQEQNARLARFLTADRVHRFDLAAPPLLRFTLIRLARDQYRLVFTTHHILLDGWSMPVLVQELLTLYTHDGDDSALPRVTPYREYLSWLAGQNRDAAASVWKQALAGLEQGTRLVPRHTGRSPSPPEQFRVTLSEALSCAFDCRRQNRISPSSRNCKTANPG